MPTPKIHKQTDKPLPAQLDEHLRRGKALAKSVHPEVTKFKPREAPRAAGGRFPAKGK